MHYTFASYITSKPYIISNPLNYDMHSLYILNEPFIQTANYNKISFSCILLNKQYTSIPSEYGICIFLYHGVPEISMIDNNGEIYNCLFYKGINKLR